MRIETKYNIGDEVWFMWENKVQNGKVERVYVEINQDYYSTHPIPFIIEPSSVEYVVKQRTTYEVSYGIKRENIELRAKLLFRTKEELLKSL